MQHGGSYSRESIIMGIHRIIFFIYFPMKILSYTLLSQTLTCRCRGCSVRGRSSSPSGSPPGCSASACAAHPGYIINHRREDKGRRCCLGNRLDSIPILNIVLVMNSSNSSIVLVQNSQHGKEINRLCPQAAAKTFAFSSLFILLLCNKYTGSKELWVRWDYS